MEVDNALQQEASPKTVYEAWTDASQAKLIKWLELPGNYDRWKFAGIRNPNGSSTRTYSLTKKAVTCLISKFLDQLQTKKTPKQVMSKMRYIEKKFKEAEDYVRNTGGKGLTSIDEKLGITRIQEKVISICPVYFQVKSFMSESVAAVNPPHIGETAGMNDNIQEMSFGTSDGQGQVRFESRPLQEGNSEEEESSADEKPNFEEEICVEQEPIEPIAQAPPQGITSHNDQSNWIFLNLVLSC